jgi:hypothetical protein
MTATVDLAIRVARAAFNRALAEADLNAIGPLLAMDVVMVTGTDSAVIAGRKAQLMAWKREFSAKERMVYVRTPDTIVASAVEPIAMEYGRWQGTVGGVTQASGDYSAKWRMTGGQWMVEAEIYLTLA